MTITQAKEVIALWLKGKREYDYLTWIALLMLGSGKR
jgi:hypothetical protein